MQGKIRITTGISQLDQILEGLYIGDNVVWHDEAGNLASIFCLNFIQASQDQNKYLVYVSFDRSPKNLIEKLGFLAQNPNLIILDCFSYGIGKGSEIFMKFYEDRKNNFPCQVIKVSNPKDMNIVMDTFYKIWGRYPQILPVPDSGSSQKQIFPLFGFVFLRFQDKLFS